MHVRMLALTLLLSLAVPTSLFAQADLGIEQTVNSQRSSEISLQINTTSSESHANSMALLNWLIYQYELVPASQSLGMLENMLFKYESIPFDYAAHRLTPAAKKILRRKAVWVKNQDTPVKINITGHCDQRGSDTYNKYLGTLRANAVKQFLITCGITHEQMKISSAGDTQPVNREDNENAWAKNRRVETIEQ